jgi:hypothetical protein
MISLFIIIVNLVNYYKLTKRTKKAKEKLFLLIDIVHSIDGESTSDEEGETDVFREKEIPEDGRKDELDIGSKTREKSR